MTIINYLQTIPPVLDFEASSLSDCSYPISAGLCVAGTLQYWLIKPRPDWIDWSLASQAIHGLKRSYIEEYGVDADQVYAEMKMMLSRFDVIYSDNPYWERRWLSHLGDFNVEIHDIQDLIPQQNKESWKETLEEQFQINNLTHHRADHDALALSLAVYKLQNPSTSR